MNSKFVIEPKYDNCVGFLELDNTRKLVRHFEIIIGYEFEVTIDVYQDGLIKIYKKIKILLGSGNGQMGSYQKNHPENIIELLLSLEVTNGEDINEHYLDLLESIYSPFCERVHNPNYLCHGNKFYSHEYVSPIINNIEKRFVTPHLYDYDYEKQDLFNELFIKTFKTLHIMKKMYENSFIC